MRILFCNIAYMNHYEGNIERDIPKGAGSWVKKHADAHEKWNFLNVDGKCYGFVQNKGSFRIEHFEGISSTAESANDVTIIWCAPKNKDKTVIVGWYKKATVFRDYVPTMVTPITGIERVYFCQANADDCFLLAEEERVFEIPRASVEGTGHGFGQQNYWYAESKFAREELIPNVMEYITEKHKYINNHNDTFKEPSNLKELLSDKELDEMKELSDKEEYLDYLPLAYRCFEEGKLADDAFFIAIALQELNQYSLAIEWMHKVIEIEGKQWDAVTKLPYWYQQVKDYEKAIKYAKMILEFPEGNNPKIRDEVNCILADNNFYAGNNEDAIRYLDLILEQSEDDALKEHTKKTKTDWLKYME